MFKHRQLLAAAVGAATIALTGVTAASAAPPTQKAADGIEYVQIMSTSPTPGAASAVAHGIFTAVGQAHLGDTSLGTIAFPGGTITVRHQAGRGTSQFDPGTCLAIISQPGTYQITGGTGRYAGITGHGTYQLSLIFVAARAHGACSSVKPPVARQELIRLTGPARLPAAEP